MALVMRCVLVLVLLSGVCLGSGLDAVEGRFSPGKYGIAPQDAAEFRTVQDMSEALSKNKNRVFSVSDASYVAAMTGVEYLAFSKAIGPAARQLRAMPLGPVSGFAGPLARAAGIQLPSVSRLWRYVTAGERIGRSMSASVVFRRLLERPTPTGLAVASGECIRIALEDYAFALDNGVDESDQSMRAAAANITEALGLYEGYTGLVDAEVMAYAQESPEGFGKMMGLCSSAIENIEAAFSYAAKVRPEGAVLVG